MRRFGFGAFLALALLVGLVGVIAYDLGISAGTADAAIAEGAAVIYAPATISPFALLAGAFLLFLLIGLIVRGASGPRPMMGPGAWRASRHDHGAWMRGDVPEPFRSMLERWHREAHDASAQGPRAGTTGRPGVPPQPPGGAPAPGR